MKRGRFVTRLRGKHLRTGGIMNNLFAASGCAGRMKYKKLILIALMAAFVVLALFVVKLVQILSFNTNPASGQYDYIVVLGCSVYGKEMSPFLKLRTNRAAALFQDQRAPVIIVSGGRGNGEEISEAEAMRNGLVSDGISPAAIILEDRSQSTRQNLENVKNLLPAGALQRLLVVSNSFHLYRVKRIMDELGLSGACVGVFDNEYVFEEILFTIREVAVCYFSGN
jgi:uncharacterized SAM-binding protein YcdF (DUF218 family)